MKKIYLLAITAILAVGANAQDANYISKEKFESREIKKAIGNTVSRPKSTKTTANRTPIWSDDFSVPSNWVTAAVNGTGTFAIGTGIPSGSFAIPGINSTSVLNGYALFDSDLDCSGNQVTNITTKNAIDLSTQPAVLLKFEQYYRRFFDSTFVFVSNDSINWVKFAVNESLANNDFSAGDATVNPDVQEVNISSVAANQMKVWIRFQFFSPSSLNALAGCGYAWMIDDVQLVPPPAFDADLVGLEAPASGCSIGADQSIAVTVKNNGANTISNFSINYATFDATATLLSFVSERITDSVVSGSSKRFEFATKADFSLFGDYFVLAFVDSVNGDVNGSNDTLVVTLSNVEPIAISPDYSQGFEPTEDLTGWVVFDADQDGVTWTLSTSSPRTGTNCASKAASATNDDWLISNCVQMDSGITYYISFYQRPGAVNTVQNAEVGIGAEANPAAFTTIIPVTRPTAAGYSYVNIPFVAPETGIFHVGFHIMASTSAPTYKIDDIMFSTNPSGLNVEKLSADVAVYPNPASNSATISIIDNKAADYKVTLTDVLGRVVKVLNVNNVTSTNLNLDLSAEANGVYLVQIQSGNAVSSLKLVVNK